MASRAPRPRPQPHAVDLDHPALTRDYEVCSRPPSAPPREGSFDVLVNCFKVSFAIDVPKEYFKYDVSAVSRPRPPRPPCPSVVAVQQQQATEATPEPTVVTPSTGSADTPGTSASSDDATEAPNEEPTPPTATTATQDASSASQRVASADAATEEALAPETAVQTPPPATSRLLPTKLLRVIVGELITQQRELFGETRVVHDGMASLYAPVRLDSGTDMVFDNVVLSHGSGFRGAFDVTVKLVESIEVDLLRKYGDTSQAAVNPTPVIQALNVVLRHLGAQRCTSIGQNLFSSRHPISLSGKKELHLGVHQSLRMGNPALHLNVDTAAAVFYALVPLIDLAMEIAHVKSIQELVRSKVRWAKAICSLRVTVTHRPKASAQAICEVGQLGADETMLLDRQGREDAPPPRSVANYFQERYSITLRHPELPVVNVGSQRFPEWLPMELCEVAPGQPCADQDGVDVAEIIKHCKQPPSERKQSIQDGLASAAFENDPFLQAFGVRVSREMAVVPARRLEAPALRVSDRVVNPVNGQWDISRDRLYRPRRLVAWCVVNLSRLPIGEVERVIRSLVSEARRRGMVVDDTSPPIVSPGGSEGRDIEKLMRAGFDQAKARHNQYHPDLIVVIKQQQDTEYNVIKRVSDSVLGVPSQCMLATKLARAKGQYFGNVVLKINMKLRGLNFVVDRPLKEMTRSAIYFGVDVDYSPTRTGHSPPIYAVVASMNEFAASFAGRTAPYVGIASTLPTMLWELLVKYEQRQGIKPDRVFYFRDGVDNGRMDEVYQAEMKALHHAWLMFAPELPAPSITFLIVTRRHHVRSFPQLPRSADRSGNTPAGSVLDQTVVDPRNYEFFLYSHNGLLGTSRPARYVVKRDDANMRQIDMEQLCFDLCHAFGRATKSVSVVAPVYYAKIFAERGRCLLEHVSNDLGSTDSDTNSSGGSQNEFNGEPTIHVHRYLRNTLFCV